MLRNEFYCGYFFWEKQRHKGTHPAIISPDLFAGVPAALNGHNKPKYKKRDFAFGGLLTCAYDDCMVTAEFKKEKYTYYRCTGYRGKCALPRMKEAELSQRLGQVLKDIYIPDDVLAQLQTSITRDDREAQAANKAQRERLEKRLSDVRRRMDQAYTDKLDGKIAEDFWQRKTADWQRESSKLRPQW